MEKSSFAMAKFGLEHKEAMPKRDCGFYVKYIFLFTSLIQFLIILGLVLFMVYGNVQAGTDTHLRLLEEQVQSHYGRIVALSATNANLSRVLNATLKDKDKLQGTALKVQKELEKCNSSQNSNSGPRVSPEFGECRGMGWHSLGVARVSPLCPLRGVVAARGAGGVMSGISSSSSASSSSSSRAPGAVPERIGGCGGVLLGCSDPSFFSSSFSSSSPTPGASCSRCFWGVLTSLLLLFLIFPLLLFPGALPALLR